MAAERESEPGAGSRPARGSTQLSPEAAGALQEVVAGQRELLLLRGGAPLGGPLPRVVLPGAFNPLHAAHLAMAHVAAQRLGAEVAFEISVVNVDKPPLDAGQAVARLVPFPPRQLLCVTRAATFVVKSQLFPTATFVVGADTVQRIGDPRYYADRRGRDAALTAIKEQGCRFLVFGRLQQRQFLTLEQLRLPALLAELCEQVDEATFRMDVSATQLRQATGQDRPRG